MKSEEKKQQPQQKIVEGFAQDGLDTSTAKMMLNSIKKEQESQAKVSNPNKEGKK